MKTVADFKRKITLGAKLYTEVYWTDRTTGKFKQVGTMPERPVSIVQTKCFALKTWREEHKEFTDSWAEFPKKSEFTALDANTVQILRVDDLGKPWCKLIYKFLE